MSDTERFVVHLDDLYEEGSHLLVRNAQTIGIPIGRTIVANGCFDILHPGHLKLLEQLDHLAYAHRLRPVVALNSDTSVLNIKGWDRPVVPQEARAALLTSLRWPFTVVIFEEDTPQRLMDVLKPKMVLKGGEYRGRDVIRWKDSEVAYVDKFVDWSTTGIMGRTRG